MTTVPEDHPVGAIDQAEAMAERAAAIERGRYKVGTLARSQADIKRDRRRAKVDALARRQADIKLARKGPNRHGLHSAKTLAARERLGLKDGREIVRNPRDRHSHYLKPKSEE